MLSYQFYKVFHLFGIFILLSALGGMCLHMVNGGTREYPARKWTAMVHGLGLLITLVGGFGLLGRLGLMKSIPPWAIVKLVIWLILGGIPALIYRKKNLAKLFWALIIIFAATSAYMAVYKPF